MADFWMACKERGENSLEDLIMGRISDNKLAGGTATCVWTCMTGFSMLPESPVAAATMEGESTEN